VFETPPLDHDVVLYGAVSLNLTLRGATRGGQIVARLTDVSPDGISARISYGVRALSLDADLDRLGPEDPFGDRTISVKLHTTAYRLRQGHTLRLAFSSGLWPLVCPTQEDAPLALMSGEIILPVLKGDPKPIEKPVPPVVDLPETKTHTVLPSEPLSRWHREDGQEISIGWHQPMTATTYHQTGVTFRFETRMNHRLNLTADAAHETTVRHTMQFDRPDGMAEVDVRLEAGWKNGTYHVTATLVARWNDRVICTRNWVVSNNAAGSSQEV